MSFKKIQKINPYSIGLPEAGHVYLGQDDEGLWEKDEFGNIWYVRSGVTYVTIISGNTSSGTSGIDGSSGTSGRDGSSGKNGSSGTSGRDGTSGTSGKSGSSGTSGTSGSSGTSGTSGSSGSSGLTGTSGTSGSSGSSGVDGDFKGSSGTSGYSGGYGGATRKWIASDESNPVAQRFYGTPNNFTTIDTITIHKTDADGMNLYYWLSGWTIGILKIEKRDNPSNFGVYYLNNTPSTSGDVRFTHTGFSIKAGNGNISVGSEYLISFIQTETGDGGSSGTSGSNFWSGETIGNIHNTNTGNVGINEENPTSLLHLTVKENVPVVRIDTDSYTTTPFIMFSGGTAANSTQNISYPNDFSSSGNNWVPEGLLKIVINDGDYWVPFYSPPV